MEQYSFLLSPYLTLWDLLRLRLVNKEWRDQVGVKQHPGNEPGKFRVLEIKFLCFNILMRIYWPRTSYVTVRFGSPGIDTKEDHAYSFVWMPSHEERIAGDLDQYGLKPYLDGINKFIK